MSMRRFFNPQFNLVKTIFTDGSEVITKNGKAIKKATTATQWIELDPNYYQLCVLEGILSDSGDGTDIIPLIEKEFNVKLKYADYVTTVKNKNGPGGRHDLLFFIKTSDIARFAIPRLSLGIRWWEDVLGNGHGINYTKDIINKYPKLW